jgi:hypothetical protein
VYAVMFKKKTESAWGFSNPLNEADAERAAAAYRRCGYDAIHVTIPT